MTIYKTIYVYYLNKSHNIYIYIYISKSLSVAFIVAILLLNHISDHIIYLFPAITSLLYFHLSTTFNLNVTLLLSLSLLFLFIFIFTSNSLLHLLLLLLLLLFLIINFGSSYPYSITINMSFSLPFYTYFPMWKRLLPSLSFFILCEFFCFLYLYFRLINLCVF